MNTLAKTIGTLTLGVALATSMSSVSLAGSTNAEAKTAESSTYFSNGWREGKIEAAVLFNEHLSAFDIDVEVEKNTAVLVGAVSSEIEKDLAEQVALSVNGIDKVDNRLNVNPSNTKESKQSERRIQDSNFVRSVKDATITANVKMKFLASEHVSGFAIDVDTKDKIVVLKGDVASDTAKDLAQKIAENVEGVTRVENRLAIVKS